MFADAFLRRPALTMKLLKPTYLLRTLLLLCALILILCALGFATLRCGGGLTLNQRRRQMKRRR